MCTKRVLTHGAMYNMKKNARIIILCTFFANVSVSLKAQ